eukprot:7002369-Lingulodinium_polyedra.AAC.1
MHASVETCYCLRFHERELAQFACGKTWDLRGSSCRKLEAGARVYLLRSGGHPGPGPLKGHLMVAGTAVFDGVEGPLDLST